MSNTGNVKFNNREQYYVNGPNAGSKVIGSEELNSNDGSGNGPYFPPEAYDANNPNHVDSNGNPLNCSTGSGQQEATAKKASRSDSTIESGSDPSVACSRNTTTVCYIDASKVYNDEFKNNPFNGQGQFFHIQSDDGTQDFYCEVGTDGTITQSGTCF